MKDMCCTDGMDPDIDGTEIVTETTAYGFNAFHDLWRKAESGGSEFLPVFLPWSIDPEYRARLPDTFEMTADEDKLAELHRLDAGQICWRRNKISQLPTRELFSQEYPLVASEAFISSDFDSFITPDLVLRARREVIEPYGPLMIGVDPAGKGKDRTAIAFRRGHCIEKIEARRGLDTMEVAGLVASIIREHKPVKVNIDVGGLAIGVYDRLIEQGYDSSLVNAVNFGGKPIEPPPTDETGRPGGGPANRRAGLWSNMKKALQGRFSIPYSNSLQRDLTSVGYTYDSSVDSCSKLKRKCTSAVYQARTKVMPWRCVSLNLRAHRFRAMQISTARSNIWKTIMPDVKTVTVQVRGPRGNDGGQVAMGAYTLEDGLLTMTDPSGRPIRKAATGERFTCKIKPGDNHVAFAGQMTLEILQMMPRRECPRCRQGI
jgi:hypothetical protein